MVTAPGFHLLPSRTEKLSPVAPMVLSTRRESRSPPFLIRETPIRVKSDGSLFFVFEAEAYRFTFLRRANWLDLFVSGRRRVFA